MPDERRYVLTLSCPDTTGIVARIAGFLAAAGGWIVEAGYHSDVDSGWFFTRQVVRADSLPFGVDELRRRFADVAAELGGDRPGHDAASWTVTDTGRPKRAVLLVSKEMHCLHDLLGRVVAGELPVQLAAVVGNHEALDVAAAPDQVGDRVAVVDPDHVLLDDRPGVEVRRHVVAGRPDELHPAGVRLVVRPRADERRQEAVVDVERPAGPPRAQPRREDLHEPGEHHGVRIVRVHQLRDLLERRGPPLRVGGERHVVERHAVRAHDALERVVVADHRLQPHGQLAGGDPPEQVVQAVHLLAHQQDRPLRSARVGHRPRDAARCGAGAPDGVRGGRVVAVPVAGTQLGRDVGEPPPQLVDVERQRVGPHHLPGEEPPALDVGVVSGLDDPTPRRREEPRDAGDDAGGVRTGQGEDVAPLVRHASHASRRGRLASGRWSSPPSSSSTTGPSTPS